MSPLAQFARLLPPATGWGVALLAMVAAAAAGAWVTAGLKDGELAQLRAAHAAERALLERRARERAEAAQLRADTLTAALAAANDSATTLQGKLDDEIRRATTGRRCLDGRTLRLLDHAAAGPAAGRLPAPAGGLAAADGAGAGADAALDRAADAGRAAGSRSGAADDGPAASDADVARWANAAYRQYAECARRLDALIDWHEPRPQGK